MAVELLVVAAGFDGEFIVMVIDQNARSTSIVVNPTVQHSKPWRTYSSLADHGHRTRSSSVFPKSSPLGARPRFGAEVTGAKLAGHETSRYTLPLDADIVASLHILHPGRAITDHRTCFRTMDYQPDCFCPQRLLLVLPCMECASSRSPLRLVDLL